VAYLVQEQIHPLEMAANPYGTVELIRMALLEQVMALEAVAL
jgi:hypothetical protein